MHQCGGFQVGIAIFYRLFCTRFAYCGPVLLLLLHGYNAKNESLGFLGWRVYARMVDDHSDTRNRCAPWIGANEWGWSPSAAASCKICSGALILTLPSYLCDLFVNEPSAIVTDALTYFAC